MNEQHLAHYGVLGMKWGIRKHQNRNAHSNLAKKDKKRISDMSDQDIRKQIDRLMLEKNYKSVVTANRIEVGKNIAAVLTAGLSTGMLGTKIALNIKALTKK